MDQTRRLFRGDDGIEISYIVIDGDEPAVLILHGLAGSGKEFLSTAHALPGRKVILIDQRGHGLSTRVPSDTSRQAFIKDVLSLIDREASIPVHMVGHSMGAHTAMLAAAARPDLVRSLVLLECGERNGSDEELEALGAYFRSWPVPFSDRSAGARFLGTGPLQRAWIEDMECREDGLHPRFDPDVMVATLTHLAEPRWRNGRASRHPRLSSTPLTACSPRKKRHNSWIGAPTSHASTLPLDHMTPILTPANSGLKN